MTRPDAHPCSTRFERCPRAVVSSTMRAVRVPVSS
jgi:hypothetical protein